MTYSSSLNIPLFEPKPTEMSFAAQSFSNDVLILVNRRLQQKLVTRRTKRTVDTRLSGPMPPSSTELTPCLILCAAKWRSIVLCFSLRTLELFQSRTQQTKNPLSNGFVGSSTPSRVLVFTPTPPDRSKASSRASFALFLLSLLLRSFLPSFLPLTHTTTHTTTHTHIHISLKQMPLDLDDDGDAERADPERSSAEIRQLIRRLDPETGGGHKDRVRRLARFRNYCEPDDSSGCTPEFYDDDIPLLFLGSQAPAAVLDEELVGQRFYGLLQACGTPSSDHGHMLKRSARPAMALLKFLVCDWKEYVHHKPTDSGDSGKLNPFAFALCSCTLEQLEVMNLELHIEGDKRGGAMEDACHVICLVTSRHLADDGETTAPLRLENVLPTALARKRFEKWLKSGQATPAEKAIMAQIDKTARKEEAREVLRGLADDNGEDGDEDGDDEEDDSDDDDGGDDEDLADIDETKSMDDYDGEGGGAGDVKKTNKRSKKVRQKGKGKKKGKKKSDGPALQWDQSDLYKELRAKAVLEEKGHEQLTVRDSQEAMAERARLEAEKAKALQKDPLGIRHDKDLDLGQIQNLKVDFLVQSLKDLEEEMNDIEQEREKKLNIDKDTAEQFNQRLRNLEAQKESLESVLDSLKTMSRSRPVF